VNTDYIYKCAEEFTHRLYTEEQYKHLRERLDALTDEQLSDLLVTAVGEVGDTDWDPLERSYKDMVPEYSLILATIFNRSLDRSFPGGMEDSEDVHQIARDTNQYHIWRDKHKDDVKVHRQNEEAMNKARLVLNNIMDDNLDHFSDEFIQRLRDVDHYYAKSIEKSRRPSWSKRYDRMNVTKPTSHHFYSTLYQDPVEYPWYRGRQVGIGRKPQRLQGEGMSEGKSEGKSEGSPRYHIVEKGQTLSGIGPKYDRPWRDIADKNKLEDPYTIYEGQKLEIP